MSDLKISQLDELFNPYLSDVLPIVHQGITKKIPVGTLSRFLSTETDAQFLFFNEITSELSIENANTISLSALVDKTAMDTEGLANKNWDNE